jgi:prepilin-type N-terminal cleavage/methylation domain-containing protein
MFRNTGFTLIELLIVMAIIIVLAGLILATAGYVQKKGYRSRAEAEIAAISAALENYKADNAVYPGSSGLNAKTDYYPSGANKAAYETASQLLYVALSGDTDRNRIIDGSETAKSYFFFKPANLFPAEQASAVTAIRDPFGNTYGYSTANQAAPTKGYNPTFDLWSTGGDKDPNETEQQYLARWIKNW